VDIIKLSGPSIKQQMVSRLVSEEVMVQLLKQKCLHILLYALDVCNLDKRSMHHWTLHLIDFYEVV